jgi:acyl-CoA dehydrogenase
MIEAMLEHALAGRIRPANAPFESAFHGHWHTERLGHHKPVVSALRGGLLADRLAWVFAAGYQAAIRAIFADVHPEGWAAYAAAEDADNPPDRPGTRLEQGSDGGWTISGCKSWIGGSRRVNHLIVTARQPGSDAPDVTVRVDARAPGVALSHRDAPGFLGDYSQGFAAFDAAPCSAPTPWQFEDIRKFSRLEARFVMLAGACFFLSHSAVGEARQALVPLVLALAETCRNDAIEPRTMAAIDRMYQNARQTFEAGTDCSRWPTWEADRRLLTMYSDRIQRRATRAAAQ